MTSSAHICKSKTKALCVTAESKPVQRLDFLVKLQVRLADQARYPHVLWPLRWTIAHSTRMVPLLKKKEGHLTFQMDPCDYKGYTHTPPRGQAYFKRQAGKVE